MKTGGFSHGFSPFHHNWGKGRGWGFLDKIDSPPKSSSFKKNISRQLRDDTFCKFLKQAKTPEDIRQLLEEADNNGFVS